MTEHTSHKVLADRFKTKACAKWAENGFCPYGLKCMFAHGDAELRTTEMNLRDGLTNEDAIKAFRRYLHLRAQGIDVQPPVPTVHMTNSRGSPIVMGSSRSSGAPTPIQQPPRAAASPINGMVSVRVGSRESPVLPTRPVVGGWYRHNPYGCPGGDAPERSSSTVPVSAPHSPSPTGAKSPNCHPGGLVFVNRSVTPTTITPAPQCPCARRLQVHDKDDDFDAMVEDAASDDYGASDTEHNASVVTNHCQRAPSKDTIEVEDQELVAYFYEI